MLLACTRISGQTFLTEKTDWTIKPIRLAIAVYTGLEEYYRDWSYSNQNVRSLICRLREFTANVIYESAISIRRRFAFWAMDCQAINPRDNIKVCRRHSHKTDIYRNVFEGTGALYV